MSYNDLPPEVQEKLKQMQNLQTHVQAVASQVNVTQNKISEFKSTLKELEGVTDEDTLYKNVGQVMFSTKASIVKKELADELELLDLTINKLKKQEENGRNQLNELNKLVSSQLNTK